MESLNNFGAPFSKQGIESMYNLAQKCIQLKPPTGTHRLTGLMIGILAENTEVIIKIYFSCSILFSFQVFWACFCVFYDFVFYPTLTFPY